MSVSTDVEPAAFMESKAKLKQTKMQKPEIKNKAFGKLFTSKRSVHFVVN